MFDWGFDENIYFISINDKQNATYEEIPECKDLSNEDKSFFEEKNDDGVILKEICSMDNLCDSDLFVL